MARRYYSSTAVATTLSGGVSNVATSFTVGATTGFPGSYPFTIIVDPDTASEEVVEVTNVSGTTLTVVRGRDGTSGVSHSTGAVVQHGVSARDFDESNAHIQEAQSDTPHDLPAEAWDLDGAWSSWTPTWANMTIGNATVVAKYKQVGKVVHYSVKVTIGSTTSYTASAGTFTLPVTAARESSAIGYYSYGGVADIVFGVGSTTVVTPTLYGSGGGLFTTTAAPVLNTVFVLSGCYEAA